ncbi:hypothetical protein BST22_22240 [Mycolicibacterium chubuense]|uniref:DUF2505 domain-containing protein n=1 Tax=Mycolicibacterium chubuense TaxID=1800 RepID=A0A0J6WIL2_MYCCU|nr:DUF2505 domain-containing protein [Mycolicibacterium chubuense]KMO83130.1 hypothetical protein MCHUDSM44219_01388 [Mycolicibacterium chubuense]ORA46062.1 hypothetical protein BST22_22240 [Mycolicibacterium chubuense]SPX96026.1 Protein of uncharacterised function (DUF2505) [Mycolicibacterium chubuense]
MPRPFDVTTETSAGVSDVVAAFSAQEYWLARLAAYGGDSMTLDSLVVDDDGGIVVRTTQDLRQEMLPGAIGRLLPGDTAITRTESWRPATDGQVHGEFTIAARGVPSSGAGTMVLQPVPAGSRLRVWGSLEVRIPIMGGRIERYVADLIAREVPQMQQFTASWIAGEA